MFGGQENRPEVISFHYTGPENCTQDIWLWGRCLYLTLPHLKQRKQFILFLFMYVYPCVHLDRVPEDAKRRLGSHGAEVIGSCGLPNVGTEKSKLGPLKNSQALNLNYYFTLLLTIKGPGFPRDPNLIPSSLFPFF